MRVRLVVVGVVVGLFSALPAAPAHACMGEVCDAINTVCHKVSKGGDWDCVG